MFGKVGLLANYLQFFDVVQDWDLPRPSREMVQLVLRVPARSHVVDNGCGFFGTGAVCRLLEIALIGALRDMPGCYNIKPGGEGISVESADKCYTYFVVSPVDYATELQLATIRRKRGDKTNVCRVFWPAAVSKASGAIQTQQYDFWASGPSRHRESIIMSGLPGRSYTGAWSAPVAQKS